MPLNREPTALNNSQSNSFAILELLPRYLIVAQIQDNQIAFTAKKKAVNHIELQKGLPKAELHVNLMLDTSLPENRLYLSNVLPNRSFQELDFFIYCMQDQLFSFEIPLGCFWVIIIVLIGILGTLS